MSSKVLTNEFILHSYGGCREGKVGHQRGQGLDNVRVLVGEELCKKRHDWMGMGLVSSCPCLGANSSMSPVAWPSWLVFSVRRMDWPGQPSSTITSRRRPAVTPRSAVSRKKCTGWLFSGLGCISEPTLADAYSWHQLATSFGPFPQCDPENVHNLQIRTDTLIKSPLRKVTRIAWSSFWRAKVIVTSMVSPALSKVSMVPVTWGLPNRVLRSQAILSSVLSWFPGSRYRRKHVTLTSPVRSPATRCQTSLSFILCKVQIKLFIIKRTNSTSSVWERKHFLSWWPRCCSVWPQSSRQPASPGKSDPSLSSSFWYQALRWGSRRSELKLKHM